VEQVDDASMAIISPFVKKLNDQGMNDIPIHLDDLRSTMPSNLQHRHEIQTLQQEDIILENKYEIKASDNATGSSDGEIKIYTIRHGEKGHDKVELLQGPYQPEGSNPL